MTIPSGAAESEQLQSSPQSSGVSTSGEPVHGKAAIFAAVTSFFALFCIVGIALWGLPFYYDFMVRDFGWTRAQVTSGNALGKLIIGPVFGFFAGWLVDRFGPRRLLISGILMAGLALIGLGSISSLSWFYVFYVVNALGYVCGGPLPCQVLISRWFGKSRGKAMGFAYLGIGIGGAAVPWISRSLVEKIGWHSALEVLGFVIILVALPFALLVKEAPQEPVVTHQPLASVRPALKTLPFALLIVGSICSIAAVSGTQQSMKLFLGLDRHYTQSETARIFSLVLGFSIAGRLLMGWLADRFPKKYVMLLIYLVVAAAIPLMFVSHRPAATSFAAALFGIGLGGDYMIIPLMTAEIFGVQVLGRLMGVLLTAGGVAEGLAPWLVGHLRDTTGSYNYGCMVLVAMALFGAAAIAMLPRSRRFP